jgi:hypothetical protein
MFPASLTLPAIASHAENLPLGNVADSLKVAPLPAFVKLGPVLAQRYALMLRQDFAPVFKKTPARRLEAAGASGALLLRHLRQADGHDVRPVGTRREILAIDSGGTRSSSHAMMAGASSPTCSRILCENLSGLRGFPHP